MDIPIEIKYISHKLEALQKMKGLLEENESFLSGLNARCFESGDTLNLTEVDRQATLSIIKHFSGKWVKSYRGDLIDYSHENGFLCIYGGVPPDSCRVVEKLVTIPAQPERQVIERVLECV